MKRWSNQEWLIAVWGKLRKKVYFLAASVLILLSVTIRSFHRALCGPFYFREPIWRLNDFHLTSRFYEPDGLSDCRERFRCGGLRWMINRFGASASVHCSDYVSQALREHANRQPLLSVLQEPCARTPSIRARIHLMSGVLFRQRSRYHPIS